MALSITDNTMKLWDAWNIRGLIILSVFLQAYLILFAPLRKGRFARKFYVRWPIWFAYLSADWVVTSTIGLIFTSNSSSTSTSPSPPKDILVFWASFLLLHLGGPDNITSYALEDNEFWKRHLFGLLLQVGFTIYAFLKSFSKNKLWLPTILVLFAGIMKYAERNVAFYRASIDHFGKDWVTVKSKHGEGTGLLIPVQFRDMEDHTSLLGTVVQLFGNTTTALVGPLLKEKEQGRIKQKFLEIKGSREVLQVLEIELSLLYEVLHTKLPVIDSKSGFNLRIANFGCISLAMITFSLAKRHYQLQEFDMLLTYGLLIAALGLDFLSIMLLVKNSDWFAIAHFKDTVEKDASSKVIERQHRWCNEVSQLNCLTYHVKGMPVWFNKMADILHLRSSLAVIKGIRCQSSQKFKFNGLWFKLDGLWSFIYKEVENFESKTGNFAEPEIDGVLFIRVNELLKKVITTDLRDMIKNLDYTQFLLLWHITTELRYQDDDQYKSEPEETHRKICKLLSDYMFYLAVMQPTMMATVLDNWDTVFEEILKRIRKVVPWSFFSKEKTVSRKILDMKQKEAKVDDEVDISL